MGPLVGAHGRSIALIGRISPPSKGGPLSGVIKRNDAVTFDAPADIAPGQRLRLLSGNHVRVETIDAAGQRAQCVYVTANGADRAGWRHAEPLDLPLSVLRAGSVVQAGVE